MSRADEWESLNESPYDDDTPPGEYVCSECGQECEIHNVDCGIGPYEFWGQKCIHHDFRWMSKCCDAPALNEEEP